MCLIVISSIDLIVSTDASSTQWTVQSRRGQLFCAPLLSTVYYLLSICYVCPFSHVRFTLWCALYKFFLTHHSRSIVQFWSIFQSIIYNLLFAVHHSLVFIFWGIFTIYCVSLLLSDRSSLLEVFFNHGSWSLYSHSVQWINQYS